MRIGRHFTEHPASVGETYGQHFRVAMRFSRCLAKAAGAAAIHAVVPSLCSKTASAEICKMHDILTTGPRAANLPVSAA